MCTHPECQRDTKNGVVLPCRYPDALDPNVEAVPETPGEPVLLIPLARVQEMFAAARRIHARDNDPTVFRFLSCWLSDVDSMPIETR